MSLDFEYGINTGNRFLNLLGHDEDPEEFISSQTKVDEKTNKSTKQNKSTTQTSTKKTTAKTGPTTTSTTATTSTVKSATTKPNKEAEPSNPASADQRRVPSKATADNNNQQQQSTRPDSSRGGRGYSRRGGSAGQDRPAYDRGPRGDGQQRSQRYNKFEGQTPRNEATGFEQTTDMWSNEAGNDNQSSGVFYNRGRGRGRGGPRRDNFEGGRGSGRGRGRGGRGYYHNRPHGEGSNEQRQETSGFQQSDDVNFEKPQLSESAGQEVDINVAPEERLFQADNVRRGRGHYRARIFRSSRNHAGDRENQGEDNYENDRQYRRQHDRQQRSYATTIKPVEKKEGEGARNWGNKTENPEEVEPTTDVTDAAETADQTSPAAAPSKDWAKQVEEAENLMTLDEYKKKKEAQKQAQQEKLPSFNRRAPNEGEDPKKWQKFNHKYQKKNDDESGEDGQDEGSDEEEDDGEQETEEDHAGKKKIITIPLHFSSFERPRGQGDSRGGQRRGGRYRDQQRSKSPQQQVPPTQEAGEYQSDQQQPRPYRGGYRQGSGRGEYRRSYGNSARGYRAGFNRTNIDPNTPDFANTQDFPTLAPTK